MKGERVADTVKGACLCGAVQFEVTLPTLGCCHCHCSICRRFLGAGYGTFFQVPRGRFRFLAGEAHISLRETLIWAWTYYGGRDPWFVFTILVEPIGGVVLLLLWLRRRPRGPMNPLLRAVGAALASWVIPFGLGAAAFLAGPGLNARGEVDDAPYRAGAGLLFLTGIFLTVLTAYFL